MKNKKIFIFILIIIFLIFLFLIELISKKFILARYQNKHSLKSIEVYKKNYNKVNHLRNPFEFSYDELIFTSINKEKNKSSILFQGDSWSEQFVSFKNSKKLITDFASKNNINFYLAGTSSYSPSIYQAQLSLLEENFGIDPEIIVVGIDQTDIGDELCRYKKKRKYVNNELIVEPYKIASEGYLYNMDNTFKRIEYLNSDKLSIVKLFLVLGLKFQEYYKIYKHGHVCDIFDITNPLFGKITEDEKNYFSLVVSEYIQKVFSLKNISNLIIVTHPHREHVLNKYKIDVGIIIKDIVIKNKNKHKIILLDFNNDLNTFLENNNITTVFPVNDPMHISEIYHEKIYTKKILEVIKKIFNT